MFQRLENRIFLSKVKIRKRIVIRFLHFLRQLTILCHDLYWCVWTVTVLMCPEVWKISCLHPTSNDSYSFCFRNSLMRGNIQLLCFWPRSAIFFFLYFFSFLRFFLRRRDIRPNGFFFSLTDWFSQIIRELDSLELLQFVHGIKRMSLW